MLSYGLVIAEAAVISGVTTLHAKNTELQNARLSETLDAILRLYRKAIRQPNPLKSSLAEGFAEVWWSGNNLRYAEALRILRHAEKAFSKIVNATDVAAAMRGFNIQPDEAELWQAVAVSHERVQGLPRGAIVLIPARRGATLSFALAA